MKIKLNQLRQIIREEVQRLSESKRSDDAFASMRARKDKPKDSKGKDADYPKDEAEAKKYFDQYQKTPKGHAQLEFAGKHGFDRQKGQSVYFKRRGGGKMISFIINTEK